MAQVMKKERKIKKDSRLRKRFAEIKKNGIVVNLFGLIPLIWSILLVGIVLWGINVAFAAPNWYLDHSNTFLTKEGTLANFKDAVLQLKQQVSDPRLGIRYVGYLEMFWNSLWFSVGSTLMKMLATICFAYVVARFEFPGRKLLYGFIILQMMLPVYGQTSANYSLLSKLGLVDTPLFLLAQGAGHGMFFLIAYSFFRNLPTEYAEAAKMDGAGPFTVFFKVMLPLARSIVSALAIMQFIACWNDYQNVIIYLKSYPTLSGALYILKDQAFSLGLQTPQYFAGIILAVLPVVILFLLFNKQIMENVSLGGLKG